MPVTVSPGRNILGGLTNANGNSRTGILPMVFLSTGVGQLEGGINWVGSAHSELNQAIIQRLRADGVDIPFPQREVRLLNPS